jgi:hypothetical protein
MKKITLSLLATSILSTAAMQASAAAPKEPGIYFYPSKAWAVGQAAPQSTDCAVQNEFNNGFVLQFDGSNSGVQSFTANFRQGIFKEGEQYKVTLSVPGKLTKSLNATATGPALLTVPLAADKDIYNTARDNAVIDLTVEQNNFRFYLVNFAPAAANFEKCMAGGVISPAKAPAPAAQTAPLKDAKVDPVSAPASAALAEGTRAAVINEAIAMEEKETSGDKITITEILPEDPQTEVQDVTHKETAASGETTAAQGDVPTKTPEAKAPEVTASPEASAAAAPPAAPRTKRMSETLAEEIAKDPSILGEEDKRAITINERTAASENPAAPPFVNRRPLQEEKPAEPFAIAPTIEEQGSSKKAGAQVEAEEALLADARDGGLSDTPPSEAASMAAQKPATQISATLPEPVAQETLPEPEKAKDRFANSADPVVHKQSAKVEADFTHVNDVEPSGQADNNNEPFAQFETADAGAFARPSSERPPATQRYTADPEMLMKISELEKQVQALQSENIALNDELKNTVSGAKEERQSIASENWNLERATLKFSESERQVKRLGDQIQRERAKCDADKKDLEAQLFDPQITSRQQLARLTDLEQKLAAAEQKLEDQRVRYEDRLRVTQSQSATQ